jgi:hypothetical protein
MGHAKPIFKAYAVGLLTYAALFLLLGVGSVLLLGESVGTMIGYGELWVAMAVFWAPVAVGAVVLATQHGDLATVVSARE